MITGNAAPERMLADFKAYATGALRRAFPASLRRCYWTHHGSTRYLWNEVSLAAAVDHVLNARGQRMAHYPLNADTEPEA